MEYRNKSVSPEAVFAVRDEHSRGTTSGGGKIKLAPILALCLSFLVVACEEEAVERGPIVRPVKIHTIGSTDPASIREYPGTIRALQTAEMGFEVPGRITEFLVREGVRVTKGEVLAKLDPRDYDSQLDAAKAALRKAQSDLNRSMSIYKQDPGAISKETIDTHKKAVEVAQAQLQVSDKAVEDTQLTAPFDGLMARKLVEDFANVQAKEPVLILQDISVLEIEVDVPERDVARSARVANLEEMTARRKPEVIVSALPHREFPAWIKEFATTADPVTRTFPVKLNFNRPDDVSILPGMTARARVVINPERAWSVPVTAAQADENNSSYVWKVTMPDMTVTAVSVELGELTGGRVLIKSGISEGDMVAVSGVTQLREGMRVRRLER